MERAGRWDDYQAAGAAVEAWITPELDQGRRPTAPAIVEWAEQNSYRKPGLSWAKDRRAAAEQGRSD
jgi:hypothetical protein